MSNSDTEIAAYYFPDYHLDSRNEKWHGKGWTEWDLVKAATPRFPGHVQPKVPSWGHFNEADPRNAEREIALAADHAITAFIFDWYWYGNKPYLNGALDNGFLQASNRSRLKFSLMWANHDLVDIFPSDGSGKHKLLAPGRASRADWEDLTDHVIARYFSQPNYLRFEGAPYFSIYELGTLIDGLGGIAQTHDAFNSFREKARSAGHPDVHINIVVWGTKILPSEVPVEHVAEVIAQIGGSSVASYVWIHDYYPDSYGFPLGSYAEARKNASAAWERYRDRYRPLPYFPNVTMGWDFSPRTDQSKPFESRGYPWMAILDGNTPNAFHEALVAARDFVERSTPRPSMITLNAWNEWTEGSFLLPEAQYGTAYLEAIRDVFGK